MLVFLLVLQAVSATVFLKEQITPDWKSRWVVSTASKDGVDKDIAKYDGEWTVEGANETSILVASVANKHYGLSIPFSKPFSFKDNKPLVLQYEVRFQQRMSCGGAYVKLLSDSATPLTELVDKTPYTILFGPDKCGADSKLLFIYRFKNPVTGAYREVFAKPVSHAFDLLFADDRTHLLTLVVKPDNSFIIKVDNKKVASGSLESASDFEPALVPPVEVDDPADSKPSDWVDEKTIVDPEDRKPDDWDESQPAHIDDENAVKPADWDENAPEYIPDPAATMPADWDEEMDGAWEAPVIPNPACESHGCGPWVRPQIRNPLFKGKWHPRRIDNPAYKGEWAPRRIANPDYFTETNPFPKLDSIKALALELWTITPGVSFSNLIVTDDESTAEQFATETWAVKKAQEDASRPSDGPGIVAIFMDWYERLLEAVEESPYLLVVITAVAGLPVVVLFRCCVGGAAPAPAARAPTAAGEDTGAVRTDDPTPVAEDLDPRLEDQQAAGDKDSPSSLAPPAPVADESELNQQAVVDDSVGAPITPPPTTTTAAAAPGAAAGEEEEAVAEAKQDKGGKGKGKGNKKKEQAAPATPAAPAAADVAAVPPLAAEPAVVDSPARSTRSLTAAAAVAAANSSLNADDASTEADTDSVSAESIGLRTRSHDSKSGDGARPVTRSKSKMRASTD